MKAKLGKGRYCGWCVSAEREQWETRVASGEAVSSIAKDTPFSASAGYRHVRAHLLPRVRTELSLTVEDVTLSDFTDRLLQLSRDAAAVGRHGKAVGDGRLVLQSIQQERELMATLLDRLGVDSTEAVENHRQAAVLVRAVASAARAGELAHAPAVLRALRAGGAEDLADAIEAVAINKTGTNDDQ